MQHLASSVKDIFNEIDFNHLQNIYNKRIYIWAMWKEEGDEQNQWSCPECQKQSNHEVGLFSRIGESLKADQSGGKLGFWRDLACQKTIHLAAVNIKWLFSFMITTKLSSIVSLSFALHRDQGELDDLHNDKTIAVNILYSNLTCMVFLVKGCKSSQSSSQWVLGRCLPLDFWAF